MGFFKSLCMKTGLITVRLAFIPHPRVNDWKQRVDNGVKHIENHEFLNAVKLKTSKVPRHANFV